MTPGIRNYDLTVKKINRWPLSKTHYLGSGNNIKNSLLNPYPSETGVQIKRPKMFLLALPGVESIYAYVTNECE